MCTLLLAILHHVQAATEGQLSRQRVKHSQLPFGERCLGRKEERQKHGLPQVGNPRLTTLTQTR